MAIKTMSEVTDVTSAARWLTTLFNVPGQHTNDRTLESLNGFLQDEFKRMPEDIRRHVRAGLNICLKELQDSSTRWYDENGDEYPRADELLLFANDNGGAVIDSNRGEVLNLVEAIPDDIDQHIRHAQKGVRNRCVQTLVGLLSGDEASREFIGRKKDKYSIDFWKGGINSKTGPSIAMVGMEKFYGPNALYEFVLGAEGEVFQNLLFELQVIVACSHNKREWIGILERDGHTSEEKKGQILAVIEAGLAPDAVD